MEVAGLGRRFLKTRQRKWAQEIAKFVSKYRITPNQISILSVVFSILCALALILLDHNYKYLLAAFFIQSRLFCNMLDGLVAIECGKASRLGDVYNDLPDRFSDFVIIVAIGYSISDLALNSYLYLNTYNNFSFNNYINADKIVNQYKLTILSLSYLAACGAIFTAYIRTLFTSLGVNPDYSGPMAKQHRMALVTLSLLLCFFMPDHMINIILAMLVILNIGLVITIYNRIKTGVKGL